MKFHEFSFQKKLFISCNPAKLPSACRFFAVFLLLFGKFPAGEHAQYIKRQCIHDTEQSGHPSQ